MLMPRPRIVKETRRPVEEMEPPRASTLTPHEWLSAESLTAYNEVADSEEVFDVYLSSVAERKIKAHAVKEAPKRLEVMGFMLGEVREWKGRTYSMVRDVVTTHLKSSSSKVRFDPVAFPELFHDLDDSGFDYVLVGWYHSHPGHTCFLSRTDLETQRSMFDQPYHSALVIDPINRDIKTFKLSETAYDEVSFAIYEPGEGTKAKAKRSRKLRVNPGPPS
jgi:proteasome lid subunit RPN8/RPN11